MAKEKKFRKQFTSSEALKSLINLNGTMAILKREDNQVEMEFGCTEEGVRIEPYTSKFKVQIMRNAFIYITELKRRRPNAPIFREDNSSLSLGHDGIYYFTFRLPEAMVEQLPEKLAHQALAIAQKVVNEILYKEAEEV